MTNATKAAKKTAAKKAPAKRVPTAAAKETPAATPEPAASTTEGLIITFMGRDLAVQIPNETQLLMWQRIGRRWAGKTTEAISIEETLKVSGQVMAIIESVIANDEDRDWLDEQMIAGKVKIQEAATIVTAAIEKLTMGGETKAPTTGPAPKARRR